MDKAQRKTPVTRPITRSEVQIAAAVAAATAVGACSSAAPLTLPPLTASLGAERLAIAPSNDTSVEVYSRIARGALRCWFGPEGSLKKTHIFHARVDPPGAGATSEISIQTRDTDNPAHATLLAYQINIAPSGSGSLVETRNARFPETQASAMTEDVARWVAGKDGCSMVGTGGWNAAPPPATAALPDKKAAQPNKAAKKPASKTAPAKSQAANSPATGEAQSATAGQPKRAN